MIDDVFEHALDGAVAVDDGRFRVFVESCTDIILCIDGTGQLDVRQSSRAPSPGL